jgi:hypothetical protein
MASSGVTAYTYTRDQIINAALRKLGVLSEGVSANSAQLSTGAEALNLVTLYFQTLGMPLWARKERTVTLVIGTNSYNLSSPKPLKIYQVIRVDGTTEQETPMEILPDYDFNLLPPDSQGVPINVTYQPKVGTGAFKVWPTPDSSMITGTTIRVTYQAEFEVYTAGTDTPDFPQEWYQALVYATAVALAPEYTIPTMDQASLKKQADEFLVITLGLGMEDGSVYFSPRVR